MEITLNVLILINVQFFRFTWRMKLLTGRRGVAILYAYMLLGLGFLRSVAPDFGDLASREQQLEGSFRSFYICYCSYFKSYVAVNSSLTYNISY